MQRDPLPIDPLLPQVVERLRTGSCLVLEAPPGAGKTTRVPPAMLEAGLDAGREILVLQPRRLAARLAARRVAEELGEAVGETVGYQVRFEEAVGPRTKIRFITEGVLTRRLLRDPKLESVGAVLLDEFHERHLPGDIGLALLRRLQQAARPDLRIVVMSATLEAAPIAAYLGDCPTLRSEGRRFEVSIEHLPQADERPLGLQVATALRRLLAEGLEGDVLVFLPGAAEIRQALEACQPIADQAGLLLLALHGDLSPADQDRAVRRADRRKVILSTNVAETSVTIDGVVAVIDSGLARVAGHSPWSGLPTLKVARVSQASAIQRAGRAGRTRPGRCLRLYTRHDFETRPGHELPEIRRLDLTESVLELRAAGVGDLTTFAWFEPPAPAPLAAAESLLTRLGALEPDGSISGLGRRLLTFPVHPRQGRLLVEAEARGVAAEGCILAALLGEREIFADLRARGLGGRGGAGRGVGGGFGGGPGGGYGGMGGGMHGGGRLEVRGPSDLLARLDAFQEAARGTLTVDRARNSGLEPGVALSVERARQQLARLVDRRTPRPPEERLEDALLISILAGYPDRVARRRASPKGVDRSQPRSKEVIFAFGGTAGLADSSIVLDADYLVAIDAEERADGRGGLPQVHLASAFEPDWLIDLFADQIAETSEVRWNPAGERVEKVDRLSFGNLTLSESRGQLEPGEGADVLWEAAKAAGPGAFGGGGGGVGGESGKGGGRSDGESALERWLSRAAFVARTLPELGLAVPEEATVGEALRRLCGECSSFAELREASLLTAVKAGLSGEQLRQIEAMAPERVTLPGGRGVRVEYPAEQPPFIESRLQDFFGMAVGPSVAGGRAPLVLHLLAPNQRAVQVTRDLAGFWARHYPALRRELGRKYPRHAWPEDPLSASPPQRK